MLKRIVSTLMLVAVMLLPLVAGCEQNDIKTERHVEMHDIPISQDTIVE